MLVKLLEILAYATFTFLGLVMLPWLLWRVWDNIIPFNKKGRGLDFDYRG